MLSTDEFAQWSQKVVLFLHNTSRVADEPYPNLLFEKGSNSFPTVSYLDAEGNLLKQVGHVTPVAQMEQAWQELQAWKALRAEVGSGAAGAGKELDLFRMELQMGNRPYAEMAARRERLAIPAAEQPAVDQKLVNLQFTEILRATPRDRQHEGGAKFLAMYRAGRIPTGGADTSFWQYLFAHAAKERDVKLFEELLAYLEKNKAGDARFQRYLGSLEEQLARLKAEAGGKR